MRERIKVVWVCKVSNPNITCRLKYNVWQIRNIKRLIKGIPLNVEGDYGQWNTNAIKQFEKFDDFDLTVVCPFSRIFGIQRFTINGINFVCFHSEDDTLLSYLKEKFHIGFERDYKKNRKIISSVINDINPDIVHIMGAENPLYSISALDIKPGIISIVSLQTLMSDPDFWGNYPITRESYDFRSEVERSVIKKCDYIATNLENFKEIVLHNIKPDAKFLDMPLALGVDVDLTESTKVYDFVYFAANIDKAGDYAIEAFALAQKKYPSLTLNMSGSYTENYKEKLEKRIIELGISNNVFFTGPKNSHEDVLQQIKKSRFALIPLKVDLISGTIREAMACGLPVVTTITPATPDLNKNRESVLLSKKGDFEGMAKNMMTLIKNQELAEKLTQSAAITVHELYSNEVIAEKWRQSYYLVTGRSQIDERVPV